MSATIQLTFDGTLVRNGHQVTMRDLAQTMMGIQSAADRACLDVMYGNVRKHQRLRRSNHELVEFIVGQPKEGSYIIDFVSEQGGAIVRRMIEAIRDPYATAREEADQQIYTIGHQINARKDAAQIAKRLPTFDDLTTGNSPLITRTYGDRSITKEFGEMLNPLARELEGSVKLVLKPAANQRAHTFEFDNKTAKKFKRAISGKQLGDPVIYTGYVRELDRGAGQSKSFRGKFINSSNKKTVTLHIEDKEDFAVLVPFLNLEEPMKIVAAPIIEFESFDPTGGDIQFLQVHHG